jgi:hypothetical protein
MSGVVNAELHIEPLEVPDLLPLAQDLGKYSYYDPLPQSLSVFDSECSITVHFPGINGFN